MKNYLSILKECLIFKDIQENDLNYVLSSLNAKFLNVKKGVSILNMEDKPQYIGIVLSGSANIIQEDYWGKRTIFSVLQTGEVFAESFSYADVNSLPISIIARENSNILLIDCNKLLTIYTFSCKFHKILIQNLVKMLANKNVTLTRKIKHITQKSTREKILSYLSECAILFKNNTFKIPFNRQELADYLSVDRSALSNILCKMRDEGLIKFHKNKFELLKNI
ncbi:transcriptional regulator, Crp/Fnr family [Candidatus Arthromitus sp. SFB-rat-Yit]|nr:transcriptional regulator, Crp/Fnr family [Candidatus Arthromitus sp. SFB-rat-Yit]